ncbi:MAG TPA: hypothetical protein VEC57_01020 [Candidatus Limnocylindrales bacterium]|nr:hypothetical protein [Candidatus Limnocylindrales bacterium]
MRIHRTAAWLATAAFLFVCTPAAHAQVRARSVYVDCQEAFLKNSATLLKKRIDSLLKCSDKLLACALEEELSGGSFEACSGPAVAYCSNTLDKLDEGEAAVGEKIAGSCQQVRPYDYSTSVGLGFRRLLDSCGAITNRAQAIACVMSRLRCRAADFAEDLSPRMFELMDRAGLTGTHPQATSCLSVRPDSPATSGDPAALAACQRGLAKTMFKPFGKLPKDMAPCLGSLFECRLTGDRVITQLPQPPSCYVNDDSSKACPKAHGKVSAAIGSASLTKAAGYCEGVTVEQMLGGLGFGAHCGGSLTIGGAITCAQDAAEQAMFYAIDEIAPRTCQLGNESPWSLFNIADFCTPECGNNVVDAGEACDDGNRVNEDTCTNTCQIGPTDSQSVSIPSSADPAHTPDGTPANAVEVGGSLYRQFGSTIFNLNNASYVRYFAPGAGDPDAVLVLVPGFAGGAHSLKIVAEKMVAKAAADGNIVLEVWAFDRRTDQLEDDAGAHFAELEDDPQLALDWYFGQELGLTLDDRLSRRAVFHEGQDIPFIANFTYNMFIHDIDAVIDAARALPSSPNVFLGGHSLGTLFSARYAATDLDPGVPVVPGYEKVDGLVLFEGNGDSLPLGPPSDDALDFVIAKADGGLYHAIRTGAASCYDGTPCPNGDSDCAALPLAAGALTNKCVPPVDAFAGGVISPQIHAVGDAVSLQGRRHPDSLSIAQVDYGSGSAVELVPGLALLDLLPAGSAEATVGFFLDDDYSPEVSFMSSMGFSDNGPNLNFGTFLLAAASTTDPYRYWKGIDWPMPPLAVPDNGAPGSTFDVNGQEKEISRMESVLTMVRTGDRNIGDWYFASSGLGVTAELIVGTGGFTGGLDSSALSVGRGRPDIENLTEGADIDIPVIAFGGSNGISPTMAAWEPFALSIAPCTAASCSGGPRVVMTDAIDTIYGGVAGGFEAYVSEGYAHIDVVSAEDDPSHNQVYDPLLAFLIRNTN